MILQKLVEICLTGEMPYMYIITCSDKAKPDYGDIGLGATETAFSTSAFFVS